MEKEKQKKNEEEMKIKKLEEDRKKLVLSGCCYGRHQKQQH